ncbi:MAG TPA: DUF917 domain-containing protein [Anaerolineae bacterium]|nr:DUF917 domain-containing protein [Anaerolineae bacterium]
MSDTVLRNQQECEDFIRGLCFGATGGGGNPQLGLEILLDQLASGRSVSLVDASSIPDEAWTVMTCGIGGRDDQGGTEEELAALGCFEDKYDELGATVAAVRALQESEGVRVEAIVPGETGALAVSVALAVGLELGVPVVDGDYAGGRAVPEVDQGIPEFRGVPFCPMALVTRWGDVTIVKDTVSLGMADRIGRMMTLASYGAVGACWDLFPMKQAKGLLVPGTLSKALHIGRVVREARERGADPVGETVRAIDGWLLFEGEITSTEVADEQSYAFGIGTHTLKGVGRHEGHEFRIWYKNEYHVSWLDGKPLVTSPDSMVMVDLDTCEPALSFDFSVGDRVAVVGSKAWEGFRSQEGLEVFGPRHFGFDIDYVPIEERANELGD